MRAHTWDTYEVVQIGEGPWLRLIRGVGWRVGKQEMQKERAPDEVGAESIHGKL